MFYRHNKTFWYQFCNFKHFLKAENSENSLASSCEEFCIGFHVSQYETGLLLELEVEVSLQQPVQAIGEIQVTTMNNFKLTVKFNGINAKKEFRIGILWHMKSRNLKYSKLLWNIGHNVPRRPQKLIVFNWLATSCVSWMGN